MIIGNTHIGYGEERSIDVNIGRLPSHSAIDIKINVARGKNDGPVLLLMGGLHGDEINGVEIVRRIIDSNLNMPKNGAVISIPILNIYGFIHFSRYVPDGKDVNRSFPGNKNGSLASRMAHYLMRNIIPNINYGIDFHTGGSDIYNYPQIRCVLANQKNNELAEAFNAPFTINAPFRAKSLRHAAAKFHKNILVYEGGESSRFDEFAITEGIKGTRRVMHYLGMTGNPKLEPNISTTVWNTTWIRAKQSGIFSPMLKCGQTVHRNQIVGLLTDPFGDYKIKIKSPVDGYIIGLNNNPLVHQGDAILHIGVSRPDLMDESVV